MKILTVILIIAVLLFFLGWMGLQIQPKPFPAPVFTNGSPPTFSVPDSLPEMVKNFYDELYGDQIPVVESALISGRAKMRIGPVNFPARFQFIHQAGKSYRHKIELTFFSFPVMKVNEYFIDGEAKLMLPFGVIENEPKVDQGANLALWGEALWFPSVFLTDNNVRWQLIDKYTAAIHVPFRDGESQQLLIRFNPQTGYPFLLEAMRYKNADDIAKTLWVIESRDWKLIQNNKTFSVGVITWFDEGKPWAVFEVEHISYNQSVKELISSEK